MTSEIDKLYVQLGRMAESLHGVQISLARQEEHLTHQDEQIDANTERIEKLCADLIPVQNHVELVNRMFKVCLGTLGATGTVLSILVALAKLMGY